MANGLFARGTGTKQDPYLIEDAFDLDAVRNDLRANYKLIANINLDISPFNEGNGWIPIGVGVGSPFLGSLNGDGFVISGMTIDRPTADFQGLFGVANKFTVKGELNFENIRLLKVNIKGGQYLGALCGRLGFGSVYNCHSSGLISGDYYLGGLIGAYIGDVATSVGSKLSSSVVVTGAQSYLGGLIGSTETCTVSCCFATGSISGSNINSTAVGGLVGEQGTNSTISSCWSSASARGVSNGNGIGGLVGAQKKTATGGAVSYWDSQASGNATSPTGNKRTTAMMKTPSSYFSTFVSQKDLDGSPMWKLFDGYYPSFEEPFEKKILIRHNGMTKTINSGKWSNMSVDLPTEATFISEGIDEIDFNTIPSQLWSELGESFDILYYTDRKDANVKGSVLNVDDYSVYGYISELPEVLVYTESTDDIIVSTTTEPFDIYDEFGEEVEVLYYTDDKSANEADLILEANWSPIDELEGDVEVVTWTDEAPDTAQRVLEMKAVPKPQFVKLVNPKRIYGNLDNVLVEDISSAYRHETRYFVGGVNSSRWSVWDKEQSKFVVKDASTEELISSNGMTHEELNDITNAQWKTWKEKYLNIGVFLKDNIRDTIVSVVDTVSYEDYLPRYTPTVKDASFYILNTTAKIDIAFNGNVLKGILADDDLSRVQYRVLLNNNSYYPSDGSFTKLGESPQNIEVAVSSKDIKIDDWNTIKIEFQDFFGTVDFWQTSFIGTYSGLMFKDIFGQYYSSEIGEVLQYLDFGIIIAGQTTIEHEVLLKNQYGYDVKNVHLSANTSKFPQGMTCEFSTSSSPFTPQPELILSGVLKNNEEMSFFIRLKTELGATPDVNGSFDIIVRADEV